MTKKGNAGRVLYDGECPLCLGLVARFGPFLRGKGFELATLQSAGFPLDEMRVVTRQGAVFGGADAVVQILGGPFAAFARIPGVMGIARALYRFIAARRNCRGGACAR